MDQSWAHPTVQAARLPDSPQELKEGVRAAWALKIRPGGVVEVENIPGLTGRCICYPRVDILSVPGFYYHQYLPKCTYVIVLARAHLYVLHHQPHLLAGHQLPLDGRPVLVALQCSLLHHPVQHDHGLALLLPDQGPEVWRGPSQWTLCEYVLPGHRVGHHQACVDVVRGGHVGEGDPAVVIGINIPVPGG